MKIDVEGVRDLYESYIIPLTKEVEVRDIIVACAQGLLTHHNPRWIIYFKD